MLHEKAESSTPAEQREADRGLLSDSSGPVFRLKHSEKPPPYGAQHRQDALWEGGNEVLPPMWTEAKVEWDGHPPFHYDDAVFMHSEHRPLPGVRLDHPGLLIARCEWHISPLGRSYFVNHNTRTTSWKKPLLERPAGCLMPECIIKCGSHWFNDSLVCLGASGNIISLLDDGSIRQWTRAGRPVGEPFDNDREVVNSIAVSPDESMIVGRCGDGRVRLWNIKEGSMVGDPWEGDNDGLWCLDWSPNGAEVAGGSEHGTIRRWNPATGRQIAPPIQRGDEQVRTIKYSPQGDKFASGGKDNMIRVWSKDGELLIDIKGHNRWVTSLCWSKDDVYIFSASHDQTIRKWQSIDGEELVFRDHTNAVNSLCLSPDGCHLVSTSFDYSVRIWDLETNRAIRGLNAKIYVWSLEAALKRTSGVDGDAEPNVKLKGCAARSTDISLVPRQQINSGALTRYGNDFWGDDTYRTSRPSADTSSPSGLRNLFGILRSSTQPANASQPNQLQPLRLSFSLFPVKLSRRPVDVPHCQIEDRYGMTHETDAEAEAAMRRPNSDTADSSTQQGQTVAGVQVSQEQNTYGQSSAPDTGEPSYLIGCCGFYLVRRRS